jgi:hypothetical protein
MNESMLEFENWKVKSFFDDWFGKEKGLVIKSKDKKTKKISKITEKNKRN